MRLQVTPMSFLRAMLASAIALSATGAAHADLIFSDVSITGSLSTGASYVAGVSDIDFTFPDAVVGDDTPPRRFGNIVITFEVQSELPMTADELILSVGGGLSGSGRIFFNEVVENLEAPGILATHNATLDSNDVLPYVAMLNFSEPSTHFKVKKTLFLSAVDSIDPIIYDLANVSLVEQNFIPEPTTLALLTLGLATLARRR